MRSATSGATFSPRTTRTARCTAAVVAVIAALAFSSAAAAAPQPLGLSVEGGEQSWHAERLFTLSWSNPPGVAAVHYRLLGPAGQVEIGARTLDWPATTIQPLSVPPTPGIYTAEVWLEDTQGASGAPVSAELRFDDRAPGRVDPEPVGHWIGRTAFPLVLRLGHPAGAEPLAGIRGYAVSIDSMPNAAPCAGPSRCSEAETDLHGGAGADRLTVAALPEGISHLNAVAVSGSGVRSTVVGSTTLRVDTTDPQTQLSGAPAGWSRQPVTLTATATDDAAGMTADGIGPAPYTAISVDGGAPIRAAGSTVRTTVIASGIHSVARYARDAAGNVADGGLANGWLNHEPKVTKVRIDREPPSLAFAGAQSPRDPELIEAHAADRLSGPDRSHGSIAVRREGSGERFQGLPTQVSGGALRARWDSAAYPPGEYEFRAVAYDVAGNAAMTTRRRNGAPMRLRNPLKQATRLIARIGRPLVAFGRGSSFAGRLLVGRRAPLAGMPVQVIERFAPGSGREQRLTTVRSAADGSFGTHLGPGPSRQVVAVLAPTATLSGASSRVLSLAVRSRVQLRASSSLARVGGRPLVFSGRVGGTVPAEGKAVELQFRLPGLAWSEFRTIRSDSRGRFRYRYSFADDDSRGVRFQFRAFVPAQAGWPFEPASSRPVRIRGV
jgi:hypothetical protein